MQGKTLKCSLLLMNPNWQSNWSFYKRGGLGTIENLHRRTAEIKPIVVP